MEVMLCLNIGVLDFSHFTTAVTQTDILLSLFVYMQRNIYSYIYAPNCCFIQSPKREGHSYSTDQDLWTKTVSWIPSKHPPTCLFIFSNTQVGLTGLSFIGLQSYSLSSYILVSMQHTVYVTWPKSNCTIEFSSLTLFLVFRNPVPRQPFHFTSREFITYSTIR